MNSQDFIFAVNEIVNQGAANDVMEALQRPPGRKPASTLVKLSEWFKSLSVDEQKNLQAAVKLATRQATYNSLLILDGLAAIEPVGPKGKLELIFVRAGERNLINDPDSEQLTNLFKEVDDA